MAKVNVLVKSIDFEYYENNYDSLINEVYIQRRNRIEKMKNKQAAYVSLASGLLLQDVLKKEIGLNSVDVVLAEGSNGKPYLKGCPEFDFNLSHSNNMLALAWGDSVVGIDIEHIEERNQKVAKRCFTSKEYDYFIGKKCPDVKKESTYDINTRFCFIWTMKEAYVKYTGTGISIPLNSFEIDFEKLKVIDSHAVLHTKSYDQYICSVCTEESARVFWDFEN